MYLRFFGSSWAAEVKNKTDALRVTKDDAATAYHVYTVSYDSTSKTWSLGVDFEVPVTVVADLNGFASQKFQFGSIYGGRILDMSAGNGVCLYEYRLYQKLLTKSQLNKILATYAAEFSSVVQTDLLSVRGEPAELGEVSPYYGSHRGYSVGQTELITAPANWTSIDGRTRTTCLGYKVYTNEVVYVEGQGNSFTYVHPDCLAGAELVWQWSRKYKVTATFASAICVATNGSDEAAGTAAAPFAPVGIDALEFLPCGHLARSLEVKNRFHAEQYSIFRK